jgi:Flp pilus assembly protein TadD
MFSHRHVWLVVAMTALVVLPLAGCTDAPSPEAEAPSGKTASLLRLADEVSARGDTITAIALYRRAIAAADEDDPLPLVKLGEALARTGAYEEAAGAFKSSLQRRPDYVDAMRGLGAADLALGRYDEGAKLMMQVLTIRPDDQRAERGLGVAFDLMGRQDAAQLAYQDALKQAPGNGDTMCDLALSLWLSGQDDAAIRSMREAATSPFAQPRHRRNLVLLLALMGEEAAAREAAHGVMEDAEAQALIARAAQIRGLSGAAARAVAIGALMSGG